MTYALIKDGAVAAYPFGFAELRRANPQVSYPRNPTDAELEGWGVFKVARTPEPVFDQWTQNVVEGAPALDAQGWAQTWSVVAASAEEIARRAVAKAASDLATEIERDTVSAKSDTFLQSFVQMTPAQVIDYINNNTANLAAARVLLVKFGLVLLVLAKRELR